MIPLGKVMPLGKYLCFIEDCQKMGVLPRNVSLYPVNPYSWTNPRPELHTKKSRAENRLISKFPSSFSNGSPTIANLPSLITTPSLTLSPSRPHVLSPFSLNSLPRPRTLTLPLRGRTPHPLSEGQTRPTSPLRTKLYNGPPSLPHPPPRHPRRL